jgi:hypothetical protein
MSIAKIIVAIKKFFQPNQRLVMIFADKHNNVKNKITKNGNKIEKSAFKMLISIKSNINSPISYYCTTIKVIIAKNKVAKKK